MDSYRKPLRNEIPLKISIAERASLLYVFVSFINKILSLATYYKQFLSMIFNKGFLNEK